MAIDESLCDQGSEPGRQRTAAMKVPNERLAHAVFLAKAEQFGIESFGDLARAAGRVDRVRRSIERRPIFPDEVIPCFLATHRTRACKREVLEMQRIEIAIEFRGGRCAAGKA